MKAKDLAATDLDAKLTPKASSGEFWTPNRLHGPPAKFGTPGASRARARSLPPFPCCLAIVETETNLVFLYMSRAWDEMPM